MRLALGVSYLGTAYRGWQSQPDRQTVQDQLEQALNQFANTAPSHKIHTLSAGRTDAGVHAHQQVVHFDTELSRAENSWVRGVNSYLPKDIAVHWARVVPLAFHCRASAQSRSYAYVLWESPVRPTLEMRRVGWTFRPLDRDAMQQAACYLMGEHDFSSFRAAECQALSPVKNLMRVSITNYGELLQRYWRFEFEANAFLHHMIRNIMGCLLMVGQGTKPPEWIKEVLDAKNRQIAAPTFAPDGLYFLGPNYDANWGLPQATPFLYAWI